MNLIKNLLSQSDDEPTGVKTTQSLTEEDHRQMAVQNMENYGDHVATLYYCELCEQVFPTFDVFYDHREASEYDEPRRRGEEFDAYRELTIGDEFPEEATVGAMEACEPC